MHLDEGQLHAIADGAASPDSMRAHLRGCAPCAAALARVEAETLEIESLLAALTVEVPEIDVGDVIEAASRDRSAAGPEGRRKRLRRGALQRAAAVALLLGGAGIAWAVPGSPIPALAERLVALISGTRTGLDTDRTPVEDGQESEAPPGVAVAPGNRFRVVLPPGFEGSLSIGWIDREELEVRAEPGTVYVTGPEELRLETPTARSRVDVEIPASAPFVEVAVGSDVVLRTDSSGVSVGTVGARAVVTTTAEGRHQFDFSARP